jgi:hypothetical protein
MVVTSKNTGFNFRMATIDFGLMARAAHEIPFKIPPEKSARRPLHGRQIIFRGQKGVFADGHQRKFEDVVKSAQDAAVLMLVY